MHEGKGLWKERRKRTTHSKNNIEAELSIARVTKQPKANVRFTALHGSGNVGHNESVIRIMIVENTHSNHQSYSS